MLERGACNGLEDWILPASDRLYRANCLRSLSRIVSRELGHGSLLVGLAGQDLTLDHYLRIGRNPDVVGHRLHHWSGLASDTSRDLVLVAVITKGRGNHDRRVDPYRNTEGQIAPVCFCLTEEFPNMAPRVHIQTYFSVAVDLHPIEGQIVSPCFRVSGDHDTCVYERTCIHRRMCRDGQRPHTGVLALHDL